MDTFRSAPAQAKLSIHRKAIKAEAERRLGEWVTTGSGLVSSSLYEACAWFSTGIGDEHTHDRDHREGGHCADEAAEGRADEDGDQAGQRRDVHGAANDERVQDGTAASRAGRRSP